MPGNGDWGGGGGRGEIATTSQNSYSTPEMPRYAVFIASPPTLPHTEGKRYTIVGQIKC